MDRGYKFYVKEGLHAAKKVIKGRKISKYKYLFLNVASFISRLLVIPAPIFAHAQIKMAKQNYENGTYEITKAFSDADSPKCYWTTIVAQFVKAILILAGGVLLGLLAFGLYYIGSLLANLTDIALLGILFAIPGIIGLVIYLIGVSLNLKPLIYYINKDNEIQIGKAFSASTRSMKEQGKRTLFFIDFFHYLIVGLYIGLAAIVSVFLLRSETSSIKIMGFLSLILFAIIFLLIIPKLGMAHKIAIYALMCDVMIDPEEADDVSLVKEKMLKQGLSKDEFLVNLFDKKIENNEEALENDEEVVEEQKEDQKQEEKK